MTPNDLIRQNFEFVAERAPDVTARFYARLFETYPDLRPLFGRNSAEAQQKMLLSALVAVVDHLDDASWLEETLLALGAKHVDYGVEDGMYPMVGSALLGTLAEVSAGEWNPATEKAWSDAIGFIATTMIRGAERARTAA